MRYILSVILGVFVTLALSIPLQQLMRLRNAEALTLRAKNLPHAGKVSGVVLVEIPPLSGVSSDPKEPRIKFIPQYPAEAAAKQIEGYVTVGFRVAADGSVEDLRVIESQPPQIFDQAARRAVSRWNFGPAQGEETRSDEQRLRLNFNLKKTLAVLETASK